MADQSQLSLLKQDARAWNEWRREHESDLADLRGANLSEANLWNSTLEKAIFERASVGFTIFANLDLSACRGLDSVSHRAPIDAWNRLSHPVERTNPGDFPSRRRFTGRVDYIYSVARWGCHPVLFLLYQLQQLG
jgi:pentapeptide repeat protein